MVRTRSFPYRIFNRCLHGAGEIAHGRRIGQIGYGSNRRLCIGRFRPARNCRIEVGKSRISKGCESCTGYSNRRDNLVNIGSNLSNGSTIRYPCKPSPRNAECCDDLIHIGAYFGKSSAVRRRRCRSRASRGNACFLSSPEINIGLSNYIDPDLSIGRIYRCVGDVHQVHVRNARCSGTMDRRTVPVVHVAIYLVGHCEGHFIRLEFYRRRVGLDSHRAGSPVYNSVRVACLGR